MQLSPAGEEFLGALVRKAKSVVKFVGNAAKSVGKVAGKLMGQILGKLRGLIRPLLRRVLSFAIGRLPAPLQPAARALATRITSEAENGESTEAFTAVPATQIDPEALAESFDVALAEAMVPSADDQPETETFAELEDEGMLEDRTLETLTEARGVLIDQLRSADESEDLGPAVEQFVPALLGALRLGIKLAGRPRVVNFLARYLAQLIGRWVGPSLKGPLSTAIVDTGLRIISLEQPDPSERDEAAPAVLASVIEDTVRRLAESDEYVFEDEDLMQLATAEAFSQFVASYFPAQFVRPSLQQAPSIGGFFIPRRPRSVGTYRRYSQVPQVELTAQMANALPSFGGVSVGAAMRAAGARFPMRVRVHIYEAAAGTRFPRLARLDRATAQVAGGRPAAGMLHPLTPEAAALLLREPRLGVQVSETFLRSRNRVAVGQRLYYLEPVGPEGGGVAAARTAAGMLGSGQTTPTQGWAVVDLRRSQIRVALYLSEAESQEIASAIKQARGAPALLRALSAAYEGLERSFGSSNGRIRVVKELEDAEDFSGRSLRRLAPGLLGSLRRNLRAGLMPVIASWVRTNSEDFARAAAHPANGVTVLVTLETVPGLDVVRTALSGRPGDTSRKALPAAPSERRQAEALPVTPGRRRP